MLTLATIGVYSENEPDAFIISMFTSIGIVLGFLAILYHIKSFRYYRKSKRRKKVKNLALVLWISAVAFDVYILFFSIFALLGISTEGAIVDSEMVMIIIVVIVFLLYAIGSLLEVSLLKKRIKKQQEEVLLKDEIDEIGS